MTQAEVPVKSSSLSAQSSSSRFRADVLRMAAIVVVAVVLGIGLNALSRRPLPLLAADGPGALPQRFERINIEQLSEAFVQRKSVLILDVRHAETFKTRHPQGAQNAPAEKFMEHYATFSQWIKMADQVVVLCDSAQCPSADRAAFLLLAAGHHNVRVLQGGWKAYEASDLPVETASKDKEGEAKQ